MFAVAASRTMAGAKRIVDDEGFGVRRFERRSKLVEASRRWQERQDAYRRQLDIQLEELRRKAEVCVPASKREGIISQVAAWHGLVHNDILGPSRERHVVAARFDAIVAVYENCTVQGRPMSTNELGRVFNRDHTSILSAFRKRGVVSLQHRPAR